MSYLTYVPTGAPTFEVTVTIRQTFGSWFMKGDTYALISCEPTAREAEYDVLSRILRAAPTAGAVDAVRRMCSVSTRALAL
jgi:hypothetical protein